MPSDYSPEPTQTPPTEPGHYRAFMLGRGWRIVHVTRQDGQLYSEWNGYEVALFGDDRWAAWDRSVIPMPTSPPTVTLA